MTNFDLASSYFKKAKVRIQVLEVYLKEEDYSDVVREAQEVVELLLKAVMRQLGMDPPHFHDVGAILLDNKEKLPKNLQNEVELIAGISKWLRKERELSFYGDVDFIPSEEYSIEEARKAIKDAKLVFEFSGKILDLR